MNREQFFAVLAPMSEDELRKALWTLYWRGAASSREHIEALITPRHLSARGRTTEEPADAALVLEQVERFAVLARKGAYLSRDRRVSTKERTRWRFTFRELVKDSLDALRGEQVDQAGAAVAILVDLACEMKDDDYVRSQDPVEAARFVVSDAVATLWSRMRQAHGVDGLLRQAVVQLVRWESSHGWTRHGMGWVAERESSLAQVLAGLLVAPESWSTAAKLYLEVLDQTVGRGRRGWGADLAEWNALIVEHLAGSSHEEFLDRLSEHAALTSGEVAALRARLCALRGQQADGSRTR